VNNRTRTIKDLLWIIALAGLVAAIFRLWFGLGATTNLSDAYPWGLWKILNMVGGVALSTSGFTVGFLVYVLRLKRFQPFMKPAILVAFLGYGCSCAALLFDIGLPHRFWHPIFMWNINSFLFEVFWCVMLYFTVTAIELAPVFFERFRAEKIARALHRAAFVVVVIGISLSSLHHSSLGSLFLVSPQRLHPLWYSPWLPLLFIVSAMGAGLMVVVLTRIIWARWHESESIFGLQSDQQVPLIRLTNGGRTAVFTRGPEGPEMPRVRALATIASGILGASAGTLGVVGAAGVGAGVGAIGGPVGLAVGAAAGALVGLAMSGYKLFKNMDSSFKEAAPDNQVMRQLEHWAKSQEDLQKEIKRRETLANELQEAERRIKELEKKLAGKEADESPKEQGLQE